MRVFRGLTKNVNRPDRRPDDESRLRAQREGQVPIADVAHLRRQRVTPRLHVFNAHRFSLLSVSFEDGFPVEEIRLNIE
jgi:hypothetical protein